MLPFTLHRLIKKLKHKSLLSIKQFALDIDGDLDSKEPEEEPEHVRKAAAIMKTK